LPNTSLAGLEFETCPQAFSSLADYPHRERQNSD
jgi:hypothetical protein